MWFRKAGKMKILITGGAGYIGSVLVPKLLERGYKVVVIDNFMYNQKSLLNECSNEKLAILNFDVRKPEIICEYMKDVDFILPFACITGAPACEKKPYEARTTIVDAIKEMLSFRENQKIIYPTTNSGYGIGQKDIYCTEKTPLSPISLYGRLKVEAEELILKSGNSISLRLATVFGASSRMRIDLLVNNFTYRALRDRSIMVFEPNFKRNFIYIGDVARAIIHCIENFEGMKNEVYNVGLSDTNISKWELCEEIKKQIPGFYFTECEEGSDPDKRDYMVSNEKIESTGFKPKTSLQKGISELIKAYQIIGDNYSNV